MSPTRNPGRIAGLWYLLLCLIGPLRLMYIPGKLFVHGNATATASNIAAHQWLFRLGIVGDLACALILIFLTLAFYRLFRGVDQYLAILVVIFGGVMPALINFVGVVSDAATLTLVRGADFLSVFNQPQRDALAMLFLRLRDHQNTAAEILWGVWLLPLAMLVYRSRFLPRFLEPAQMWKSGGRIPAQCDQLGRREAQLARIDLVVVLAEQGRPPLRLGG